MIHEIYAPTRGVDFLQITCVTDTAAPLRVVAEHDDRSSAFAPTRPPIHHKGFFYWRLHADGLRPGTAYSVRATPKAGRPRQLAAATLSRPSGPRRLRLGVLADPHCTEDRPSTARLYELSFALFERYLRRLVDLGADAIIVPGDITDAGSPQQFDRVLPILHRCPVPVHVIVGNHDYNALRFLEAFRLTDGYRGLTINGVRLVLLHTHSANDLGPKSGQLHWLAAELADHADLDTLVFSHFALVRHPYHVREKNPAIHNHQAVAELLARFPRVRAAFAGHKNVPARSAHGHVEHVICPQLCQAPCGYDLIDVYEGGMVRHVFEIDDLDLLAQSKAALASPDVAAYRYGLESGRNFSLHFEHAARPAGLSKVAPAASA